MPRTSLQNISFTASPQVSDTINQALLQDRRYHPNLGGVTRGGIANHYPMAILALQGLGASDEEVAYFNLHGGRHRAELDNLALLDRQDVTVNNWPEFLGQSGRLLEFRRVFSERLTQSASDIVIAEALAVMQNALPMGLFHPLIRLSFAASHGDQGLIADALAYLAIRYSDMFGVIQPPVKRADNKPVSAAEIWRGLIAPPLPPGASLHVCERLCGDPLLQQRAGFPDSESAPAEMIRLALRLYLSEPALTTLHAVTSAQALAELQQLVGAEHQAVFASLWQRYWIWLTGLYLEKGQPAQLPDLDETSLESLGDWDQLAAQARTIPETHLIKMTYSCLWLDRTFGPDGLYRVAVDNMLKEGRAHPRAGSGLPLLAL